MDRECYDTLVQLELPNVHVIALQDFEAGDEKLLAAKNNRSLIEYYFTCTPSLPLFILARHPEVDLITYLDADLFFFDSPRPLFDEIGAGSVAVTEHRCPPDWQDSNRHGIYNVGWLSFRRDEHAVACLRWWREQCIEWCYDRVEDGRFADQKYLDSWPDRFSGVVVLHHKGANVAPWNVGSYKIRENEGRVYVDEQPLIFFHFHGLKKINAWIYNHNLGSYDVRISSLLLRSIYTPYIADLVAGSEECLSLFRSASPESGIRHSAGESVSLAQLPFVRRAGKQLTEGLRLLKAILGRRSLVVINGRVL